MTKLLLQITWLLRMAWRDSRRQLRRLLLFISAMVLGVAALVATRSFGDNLLQDIDNQAKELLGADLVFTLGQAPTPRIQTLIDTLPALRKASEINFVSMVYFPKNKGTRLVQVRALEGGFPFYGKLETEAPTRELFRTQRQALVETTLMRQFETQLGDTIRLGNQYFTIEGSLLKAPGQTGIGASVAAPVYVSKNYILNSGLLQKGSRINYAYYFQFAQASQAEQWVKRLKPILEKENIRYETIAMRKQNVSSIFSDITQFFNLLAFIALLLGAIGVASAVSIYMQEKVRTVALLRCIGASSTQIFWIFWLQITIMGLLGTSLGIGLGLLVQLYLPQVFAPFLPFMPKISISLSALGQGLSMGLLTAWLFALLPLLRVQNVSPLLTLRSSLSEKLPTNRSDYLLKILVYGIILLFVFTFTYVQTQDISTAFFFTLGAVVSIAVLGIVARSLMWLIRRFFPTSWNFIVRQALANLYRPKNQTLTLILTIGLGTGLMATLYLVQGLLLQEITFSESNNQPNLILFDVQTSQKQAVRQFLLQEQVRIEQEVPIVTMQLLEWKGKTREQWLQDSSQNRMPKFVLNREYRCTYRSRLTPSEKIVKGKWYGRVETNGKIYVSVEEFQAKQMKAQLGDKWVFNVQGVRVETYVGSIRKVSFDRAEPVFSVVFPAGVLEDAPQFHVFVSKVRNVEHSAQVQRQLVQQFPNVSTIDLLLVLKTVQDILGQISFVVQFMAMFSILTGLVVLVSSLALSRFQRLQENVLLRTLGASRKQILQISLLEYLFLGSIATLLGILLSLIASYLLAIYLFETDSFVPNFGALLGIYASITGMVVGIGWFNNIGIFRKSPLEVLRQEV